MQGMPDLSMPTLGKTLLGAAVGACSGGLLWASQAYFLPDPTMTSTAVLLFAGMGGLVGYLLGTTRERHCPQCGKSMGKSQSIRSVPIAEHLASQVIGKSMGKGQSVRGRRAGGEYYLCEHCDQEYRLADLVELEARGAIQADALTASTSNQLLPAPTDSSRDSCEHAEDAHASAVGKSTSKSDPGLSEFPTPDGWIVEVTDDQLSIIRDTPRVAIFLAIAAACGAAAALDSYGIDDWRLLLGLVPMVLVFIVIHKLLNERTIVNVCSGKLSIVHRPIPWPGKRVNVTDIRNIYCLEHYHTGSKGDPGYYTYDVKLLMKSGRRKKLAAGLKNEQHALALERTIQSFLGIGHRQLTAKFYEKHVFWLSRIVVVGAIILCFLLWSRYGNNETDKDRAGTARAQPDGAQVASAQTTQDYIAKARATATFEEIRGSRWRQFRERPSSLPDDEVLIEFRDDMTGVIQAKRGTRTLVDTQMSYEISPGEGPAESLRISLSGGSEINARLFVNADANKIKIYSPSTNGKLGDQLKRYFHWQLPFARQPDRPAGVE